MSQIVASKVGMFGGSGSGKTTTAALLLAAISVELHGRAPVHVFDTEPGWQFMRRIFSAEGVPLKITAGRSFQGMCEALKQAEKEGACGFVADSMTHTWSELLDTFAGKSGRVEFQQFNLIKRNWNNWTIQFLNSSLHCFALGRLGWEYDTEKNEKTGKREIVKGDSKFKAGGGESFGYEPHLLIEMELEREGDHNGRGGTLIHVAHVLKDRARILNGKSFDFEDFAGYKKGDYKKVWQAFLPHLEELQMLEGAASLGAGSSAALLPENENGWYKALQAKKVALETIETTMGTVLWPGQTAEVKKIKTAVLEHLFATRSWSAVENMPLEKLEAGVNRLRGYESMVAGSNPPTTEAGVMALFAQAAAQPPTPETAELGMASPTDVF